MGKDGNTGEMFILQARPETVQSRQAVEVVEDYKLKQRGPVRVIKSAQFLVTQGIDSISLNPDTVMKTSAAILEKEKALKQ